MIRHYNNHIFALEKLPYRPGDLNSYPKYIVVADIWNKIQPAGALGVSTLVVECLSRIKTLVVRLVRRSIISVMRATQREAVDETSGMLPFK